MQVWRESYHCGSARTNRNNVRSTGLNAWEQVEALRFPGREFDPSTGVARFRYALGDLVLTETVDFWVPSVEHPALERVLDLLYVAASTSYYKIAAPKRVELDGVALADGAL